MSVWCLESVPVCIKIVNLKVEEPQVFNRPVSCGTESWDFLVPVLCGGRIQEHEHSVDPASFLPPVVI